MVQYWRDRHTVDEYSDFGYGEWFKIKTRPPTFALYANRPADIPDSYIRYLENELRKTFKLPGIPIRFQVKGGKNPYHEKSKKA